MRACESFTASAMSSRSDSGSIVAHISAHPDDEALASPGVLFTMQRAGWRVINFVATMGRPEHRERRSREAACAARAADFELHSPLDPIGLSSTDDLDAGFDRTRLELRTLFREFRPEIVVAPSPHDGHHAHELVGRAVLSALEHSDDRPRLWLWGLWCDLPFPTIYAPYDEDIMRRALTTVQCYAGEIERNDYPTLLVSRARANAILGVERVFGYGQKQAGCTPYVDLLMECMLGVGGWMLGQGRLLSPEFEPIEFSAEQDIGWWLKSPSPHERRRTSRQGQRGLAV